MRRTVVIFARTPRRGMVKRRLARQVGDAAALQFHRLTLESLMRRLTRDPRWCTVLAVTQGTWRWPRGMPRIRQTSGDLGTRMAHAMAAMPSGPVLLVGSDVPGIGRAHIASAFRALAGRDVVFGPAHDGGYWLVGVRRRELLPRLFRGVRWSTEHALADTIANLASGRSHALADLLSDVDDAAALRRLEVSRR